MPEFRQLTDAAQLQALAVSSGYAPAITSKDLRGYEPVPQACRPESPSLRCLWLISSTSRAADLTCVGWCRCAVHTLQRLRSAGGTRAYLSGRSVQRLRTPAQEGQILQRMRSSESPVSRAVSSYGHLHIKLRVFGSRPHAILNPSTHCVAGLVRFGSEHGGVRRL